MAPGKETISYCWFAKTEEDYGEERSRLESFEVDPDEGRSLEHVSIMHDSVRSPGAVVT